MIFLCIIFLSNYHHIELSQRSDYNRLEVLSSVSFSNLIWIVADVIDLTALDFDMKIEDNTIYGINCK